MIRDFAPRDPENPYSKWRLAIEGENSPMKSRHLRPGGTDREAKWIESEIMDAEDRRVHASERHLWKRALILTVCCAIGFYIINRSWSSVLELLPLLGFVLIGQVAIVGLKKRELSKARFYSDANPGDQLPQWNVDVDIVQLNVVTGHDSGKLWIEDRMVFFAGRRTSFVLAQPQLGLQEGVVLRRDPTPLVERRIGVPLETLGDARDWSLQIDPEDPGSAHNLFLRLDGVSRNPNSQEPGQFPPKSLGPYPVKRLNYLSALGGLILSGTTLTMLPFAVTILISSAPREFVWIVVALWLFLLRRKVGRLLVAFWYYPAIIHRASSYPVLGVQP